MCRHLYLALREEDVAGLGGDPLQPGAHCREPTEVEGALSHFRGRNSCLALELFRELRAEGVGSKKFASRTKLAEDTRRNVSLFFAKL